MKYNEDIILELVKDFIQRSYKQHYSTDGKGLQASTTQQARFIADEPTNAPE